MRLKLTAALATTSALIAFPATALANDTHDTSSPYVCDGDEITCNPNISGPPDTIDYGAVSAPASTSSSASSTSTDGDGDTDGDTSDAANSGSSNATPVSTPAASSASSPGSSSTSTVPSGGVGGVPSSFASCVATRESSNGTASPNIYGILPMNGYQAGMSPGAQQALFTQLYQQYGTAPWAPYDGC